MSSNGSGAAARRNGKQPSVLLTQRDVSAMKWISEQFAVRLDDVVLGEAVWAASKSLLSGMAVLMVAWALGLVA